MGNRFFFVCEDDATKREGEVGGEIGVQALSSVSLPPAQDREMRIHSNQPRKQQWVSPRHACPKPKERRRVRVYIDLCVLSRPSATLSQQRTPQTTPNPSLPLLMPPPPQRLSLASA